MAPKATVNWFRVEEAMRRSVRGHATDQDRELAAAAHRADPVRYGQLHGDVRQQEQDAVRRLGRP